MERYDKIATLQKQISKKANTKRGYDFKKEKEIVPISLEMLEIICDTLLDLVDDVTYLENKI